MVKKARHRIDPGKVLVAKMLAAGQVIAKKDAGPPSSKSRRMMHWSALHTEYEETEARQLLRAARNLLSFEVARVGDSRERTTLPELLSDEERVLVVGAKGSGKSAIVAHLAMDIARKHQADRHEGLVPFVVPVELLESGERLDVATLARLSPAAGQRLIERMLSDRRALVVVDGLDRAPDGPAPLFESIAAFARAHAGNRLVVTTRPLGTGIAGYQRIHLPDFTTVVIAPPVQSNRVHPAHRFLARRTPARKAALFLERVYALQEAWTPPSAPPESLLGRLSADDQGALCTLVAMRMHDARSFEIAAPALVSFLEPILWCSEDGTTPRVRHPVEDPPDGGARPAPHLASALVAEIRERRGPLGERRPGWLAFADFAFQEVLVARAMAGPPNTEELLLSYSDPWWHGVLELTAGLLGEDAGPLVSALLDADPDDSPAVTMLAARCAEATSDLPGEVRRSVDARLSEIVPPRSVLGAERLARTGDVGAPLLLRALPTADATQRALSAFVLGQLRYEPACPALIALSTDTSLPDGDVGWPFGEHELEFGDQPVGLCALTALFEIARGSRVGLSALRRAMARAPFATLDEFRCMVVGAMMDPLDRPTPRVRELVAEVERVAAQRTAKRKKPRG